jgi:hypothetical protein
MRAISSSNQVHDAWEQRFQCNNILSNCFDTTTRKCISMVSKVGKWGVRVSQAFSNVKYLPGSVQIRVLCRVPTTGLERTASGVCLRPKQDKNYNDETWNSSIGGMTNFLLTLINECLCHCRSFTVQDRPHCLWCKVTRSEASTTCSRKRRLKIWSSGIVIHLLHIE